jgi:monooxygenase
METKLCAACAWRGSCQIKFAQLDGIASNCIHFTRDVELERRSAVRESADVVIAGAGIGGLSLGLFLAEKGYRIIILERGEEFVPARKPEVLQPWALEILQRLGALDGLLAMGPTRCERYHFYQAGGRPLVSVRCSPPSLHHAHGLIVLSHWTRQALLEKLQAYPRARLLWGADLMDLTRARGAVAGVRAKVKGKDWNFSAPVVVGADGAASQVRAALKVTSEAHRYPDAFVSVLVDRPAGVGSDVHYYVGRRSFLGVFPVSSDALCLLLSVDAEPDHSFTSRLGSSLAERVAAMAPAVAEAVRASADWGHAALLPCACVCVSRWVSDGAALLGDSAHACHPYMGLGSALAIEDARVLAQVLEGCFQRGDFSAEALAAYEAARRPAVERLQRLADQRVMLWNTANPFLAWTRSAMFRAVAKHPRLLSKEFIANAVGVAQ